MKQFAKRMTAVFTMIILAVGVSFTLAACGSQSSDEQLIKTELSKVLDAFKNPTEESLSPYMGDVDSSALEAYGIDIVEMMQHLFKHFDYSIDSVTVDGDKATAKLTVENIDTQKVITEASAALTSDQEFMAKAQEAYVSGGEKAMYKLIFDEMYAAIDAETDTVKGETEITLTKTNGQWDVDEDSMTDFISKVYGGLDMSSL